MRCSQSAAASCIRCRASSSSIRTRTASSASPASVIRLAALTHQGSTAILRYDIVIESPTFGEIADEARVMRLVNENGWKIAWSSMDIFEGLSGRTRLTVPADFPERANIYDRNGKLLAEEGGEVYSLYVVKGRHGQC